MNQDIFGMQAEKHVGEKGVIVNPIEVFGR
jgi:hypothetical protein